MKINKTVLAVMVLLCLSALVPLAHADDMGMNDFAEWFGASPNDYIKTRTYIGVLGISADINNAGDFNGNNTMVYGPVTFETTPVTEWTNQELDQVPAVNRNFGFSILMGQRIGPWAMELSFWQSNHTASYTGGGSVTIANAATLQSFDVDIKRYFFTQLPTQPFFSMGLSFPWLTVANGSEILNTQDGTLSNGQYPFQSLNQETISGIGLELGVGLEIYLGNGFSLVGGAYQRWTEFNQINGAIKIPLNSMYFDNNPSDIGALEGDGINFYVGSTVGFE